MGRGAECLAASLALALAGCLGLPNAAAPYLGGSVGLPHAGVLTGGEKLPDRGPGFRRFRSDEIRWGNPRLVRAITRAAARVAEERPGGPPLIVADLSAKEGGGIPRHRSHRSGRDADLLLYAMTPSGVPVESPGFVAYASDGFAPSADGFVRLDVERNWLLVKALVSDEEAQVQFLFVARWVEALITEHAIARGEDDELVWRAAVVMRQPGDSAAHADHFHLRIGCTVAERAAGCAGGGPDRPWWPAAESATMSDAELLDALFDGGAEPDQP
jgi:penicillin-insensitive murein endopeptidase